MSNKILTDIDFIYDVLKLASEMDKEKKFISDLYLIKQELSKVSEVLDEISVGSISPFYMQKILLHPIEKSDVLDITLTLIKTLIERGLYQEFIYILENLDTIVAQYLGKVIVNVTTVVKMQDPMLEKLQSILEGYLQQEIILNNIIDANILGGIVVASNALSIDDSIKKHLQKLSYTLKGA